MTRAHGSVTAPPVHREWSGPGPGHPSSDRSCSRGVAETVWGRGSEGVGRGTALELPGYTEPNTKSRLYVLVKDSDIDRGPPKSRLGGRCGIGDVFGYSSVPWSRGVVGTDEVPSPSSEEALLVFPSPAVATSVRTGGGPGDGGTACGSTVLPASTESGGVPRDTLPLYLGLGECRVKVGTSPWDREWGPSGSGSLDDWLGRAERSVSNEEAGGPVEDGDGPHGGRQPEGDLP